MTSRKSKKKNNNNNGLLTVLDSLEEEFTDSDEDVLDMAFLPDAEESDQETSNDENISDDESDTDETQMVGGHYEYFRDKYNANQKLLEPNHNYDWVQGESPCVNFPMDEEVYISVDQKTEILKSSHVQLFELFISDDLKQYIIDATMENGYELSMGQLNTFIGILITTIINSRKHQKDYWSKEDILRHDLIASVMSRLEFLSIKRFLKLSKESDRNDKDRVWRVRKVLNIFRGNLQQLGFFSSKLSIDESMIKFFGRSIIKQYMRNKPIKFGLKLWCICSVLGYIFDFDIYCGKGGECLEPLKSLNLGSRVVLLMLHNFLMSVPIEERRKYHICFDNFFSSPDLLVHLNKLGLKATGTVRHNRVYQNFKETDKKGKEVIKRKIVPIAINKNDPRGSHDVKYDRSSQMNFISVQDSKIVSVLSTATGVTPQIEAKRYSSIEKKSQYSIPKRYKII